MEGSKHRFTKTTKSLSTLWFKDIMPSNLSRLNHSSTLDALTESHLYWSGLCLTHFRTLHWDIVHFMGKFLVSVCFTSCKIKANPEPNIGLFFNGAKSAGEMGKIISGTALPHTQPTSYWGSLKISLPLPHDPQKDLLKQNLPKKETENTRCSFWEEKRGHDSNRLCCGRVPSLRKKLGHD